MQQTYPFKKQPLLELHGVDKVENTHFSRHPHGWSRQIRPLHAPGEVLNRNVLSVSPLYLEIGCGHGDFIVQQAGDNPDGYYIGVENVHLYAISAARRVEKKGANNVLILNQNANTLLREVFPRESLDRIYILYPDPWPKNRHEKRRLIREATYQHYGQALKLGGEIEIWTDTPIWIDLSLPFLERLDGTIEQNEISDEVSDLRTTFEKKAKSKQHPIFHILFQKRPQG